VSGGVTSGTLAAEAAALAFLDLSEDEILELREAKAWRFFAGHGDPARFSGLVSIPDLDAFLRTEPARAPRIGLADGGRQGSAGVPEEDWAFDDGRVDLPRLFALFDAGASLVVSQFHEIHPPLARFCRGLERLFLHAAQANIYLTPPGAQGFRPHFDTHDVLVMQISGHKDWRVWDGQPLPDPTRRTPWRNQAVPDGEPFPIPLHPGDVLYVPRGVMHDAATQPGGEPSLHVTIGLLEPCWAEGLRRVLDLAEEQDPDFRAAIPTWRIGEQGFAAAAAALTQKLASPALMEALSVALLDRLAEDRLQMPHRGLLAPPPTRDQRLRLADAMHSTLVPLPEGGASLRYGGGALPLTAEQLGWLQGLEASASSMDLPGDAWPFLCQLHALGLLEPG